MTSDTLFYYWLNQYFIIIMILLFKNAFKIMLCELKQHLYQWTIKSVFICLCLYMYQVILANSRTWSGRLPTLTHFPKIKCIFTKFRNLPLLVPKGPSFSIATFQMTYNQVLGRKFSSVFGNVITHRNS